MAITGTNAGETLPGTTAADQIYGLGGNDILKGNEGNDNLFGGDGNDKLDGNIGNDYLDGGNGNDVLDGGAGYDSYVGGAGSDTFMISAEVAATNNSIIDFQLGADRIDLSQLRIADFATLQTLLSEDNSGNAGFGVYRNGAWISNVMTGISQDDLIATDFLFSTAISNDTETGGNATDDLFGGLGNDTLSGGTGNDRLFGEAGDDHLYGNIASAPDGVAADGSDWLYGGAGNDFLFGGSQTDSLLGGDGNDRLDGGMGNDYLTGGAGNDVFVMRHDGGDQNDSIYDFDLVLDKLDVSGLGISDFDTLKRLSRTSDAGDLALVTHIGGDDAVLFFTGVLSGNLTASSVLFSSSINAAPITGSIQADDLFGGLADNTISGGIGNDRIFGEQGNDNLYGYDSLTPAGNAGDGLDLLFGGAGNDQLFGGGGNDTLFGDDGSDILTGGVGADQLHGGAGLDTVSYAASVSAVTIRLWNNTVKGGDASGDFLTSIENITGSSLSDILAGDAQNNVLNGLGGEDSMNGREGNDSYFVDSPKDFITDRSGIDTVNSTFSYTLGSTLENLILLGTGSLNGTGNDLANTLSGNAGNNVLNGLGGTDTVSYANATAGISIKLWVSDAQYNPGAGSDKLLGFENITGSGFNDTLTGNNGVNKLVGGAGADTLVGAAGVDSFVFNSKIGADTITDFVSATDKLIISQAGIRIGDGDTAIEGGIVKPAGSGGFAPSAELVIMQQNIAGGITTDSAATAIGSASAAYATGKTVLFAVDNGTVSGVFLFTSAGADALVSAEELTLLGTLSHTAATTLADYGFVG